MCSPGKHPRSRPCCCSESEIKPSKRSLCVNMIGLASMEIGRLVECVQGVQEDTKHVDLIGVPGNSLTCTNPRAQNVCQPTRNLHASRILLLDGSPQW